MKNLLLLFLFITSTISAQTSSEVYLFDLSENNGKITVSNGKNISNTEGYDSQPSFYSSKSILFASTRDKQTDIAKYNIETGKVKFLNSTKGGEYSPQRIPKSKDITAVRLDPDGLQRLYKYDAKTGTNSVLIPELKVAYPMWYNKNTVIAVVIIDDGLDLMINKIKSKKNTTIQKKVGRSVHKIPNTKLVSYISKVDEQWEIRSLDPKTRETKKIVNTLSKKEDICWLPNGTILMASGNTLMKFNPKTDKEWSTFHTFPKDIYKNISRIIVNKKGTQLALVSN